MKITTKITFFMTFCFIVISTAHSDYRAVKECGVKSYKKLDHRLCVEKYGEMYAVRKNERTVHCGSEVYKVGTGNVCGTHREKVEVFTMACAESNNGHRSCPKYEYVDEPNTCRHSSFGTQTYKSCRHESHGVEAIIPCEHESFGVDEYFKCEIRKTKNELVAYFQEMDANIELFGKLYFTNKASMFKLAESPVALACFIKKWEANPLTAKMINDLKQQYPAFQGTPYSPSLAINCDFNTEEVSEIDYCDIDSESRLCLAQKALNAAKEYLIVNEEETRLLQDDVVARDDPIIKERLQKYNELINHYLNQ